MTSRASSNSPKLQFLLATTNQGKLLELQALLKDLSIQLRTLSDLAGLGVAPEDGASFAENAQKKALYYQLRSGLPTIADDSGLVVDALNGLPGVESARFAATDELRIKKVLRRMHEVEEARRTACFVCAICVAFNEREYLEVQGVVEGRITRVPRGRGGFGYDPIFLYPPLGKTFAEMTAEEKNRVSHRGKALSALRAQIPVAR